MPAPPLPGLAQAIRRARDAICDDAASAAVVFALAAPLVVASAALSVESGFDYYRHTHLQAAADAAAYAGAIEKRGGTGAVVTGATSAASANGWSVGSGSIQVNSPPTSGGFRTANAVEVRLSETVPRFFTALFVADPIVERVRAVAAYQNAANACVLALNKTASKAIQIQGNASMNLVGCDLVSNSIADDAIYVWGSADVSAGCLSSAGGITTKSGVTLTDCASAITQAPRTPDPFAGLPTPPTGPARSIPKANGNSTTTLSPGWYSSGMDLSGDVSLQPGTYYVSGGDFRINGNASVSGTGVTIFLAAGSQLSINGNTSLSLTAPTSGAYAGMLFFGDPAGAGGVNRINGNADLNFTGNLYFPTQELDYSGNFSGQGGCMHIVADRVVWTGSATVKVDCSSRGMAAIPTRQTVRLVE